MGDKLGRAAVGLWNLFLGAAVVVILLGALPEYLEAQQESPVVTQASRQAQVGILDAAQAALANYPLLRVQQAQIKLDRGLTLQASSAFDSSIQATITPSRVVTPLTQIEQQLNGVTDAAEITDETQVAIGLSKLLRSGITLSPSISLMRDVDNVAAPNGTNDATPAVQLIIPLLRRRGREIVTAPENAARMEERAATLDLTQQIAQLLDSLATDYWNLVAAQKLLRIAQDAEKRATTDLDDTRALVGADQLPRENLHMAGANLEQTASNRLAAEQSLSAAQYQLALDMGLSPKEITVVPLLATDDFPPVSGQPLPIINAESLQREVQSALLLRPDYLAVRKRIDEQQLQVQVARNSLLPQVNVTLNAGYTGLSEGRQGYKIFSAAGEDVQGVNASAEFSYTFPPKNDQARGVFLQEHALQTQLEMQEEQLRNEICVTVATQAQAVQHAAEEAQRAERAVDLYRASLEGQREKYHLGIASIVDVLTVEASLTAAETTKVQADLAFAQAVAQFRYATGTLVVPGQMKQTLSQQLFFKLPALAGSVPPRLP